MYQIKIIMVIVTIQSELCCNFGQVVKKLRGENIGYFIAIIVLLSVLNNVKTLA